MSKVDSTRLNGFANEYLKSFPLEEWEGRELGDHFEFTRGLWLFLRDAPGSHAKVKVFNPNLDEHGWLCGRTVITVLQHDMPFLVDSLRLELNRRDIPIHVIYSSVMAIGRDEQGNAADFRSGPEISADRDIQKEALIYIEINLHTDESLLTNLSQSLVSVLDDVNNVVVDYRNVLLRLEQCSDNVSDYASDVASDAAKESSGVCATQDKQETLAFLHWLQESHYTFLGYREYSYTDTGLKEESQERLGIFRKLTDEVLIDESSYSEGMRDFHSGNDLICFSKSATRSNVHRGVYPDYIVVKKFNEQGEVCGEVRFMGLFTYSVFTMSPMRIPLLRKKVDNIVGRSGLDPHGHEGKNLVRVIENFPKEELFQSDQETLFNNIWSVVTINERHVVRLIIRRDPFGSFVNCMVYIPRDRYTTRIRLKIQALIGEALDSKELDSTTFFSESTLARAQFVFRVDPDLVPEINVKLFESAIQDITRNWEQHLQTALVDHLGESKGIRYFNQYRNAFSQAYQENYDARSAAADIDMLESLQA